jgi:hypothetical protein
MTQEPGGGDSSHVLLVGSAGLFALSSVFPVAASLLQVEPLPRWVGVVDVVTAIAFVALAMAVVSKKPSDFPVAVVARSLRIYRGLASTFLILLVLFFLAGESIKWGILLPGLAWRGWLLAMALPSWLSLWQTRQRSVEG